jgi:hypothetical protein
MNGPTAINSILEATKQRLLGQRKELVWRAYTRSGKVVVIKGYRVVSVIDPKKGDHAK